MHPTGELISVDDDWKKAVRDELDKRSWTQGDLAREISGSPGAVTGLLKPISEGGVRQSKLVHRIHQAFGWTNTHHPAVAAPLDTAWKKVQRKWPTLTDEDRAIVSALVESLAAKR